MPPDPDERSFSDLLQPGIRQLREQRGPCPSVEDLIAFHRGELSEEKAKWVRDHVEACGLCDVELGRLEPVEYARPGLSQRFVAFLRNPVVPYVLVALLLVPAYRGVVSGTKQFESTAVGRSSAAFGVAPIQSLSLDTVRSASAGQSWPVVRVSDDEAFFLLSFLVPMKPSPYRYAITVSRRDGAPVVSDQLLKNCDSIGNCSLLCAAKLFPPSRYELRVTERGAAGESPGPHFQFETTR